MVVAGGDKAADSPVGFRSEWKGLPQPVEPASWQQGTHQETSFSQSSCDTGVTLIPIVHSRSWASEIVCAFPKSLGTQCGAGFEAPARGASGDAGEDSFMGALPSPGVTELFLLVPTELDP